MVESLARISAMYEDSFTFLAGNSARVTTVASVLAQDLALPTASIEDVKHAATIRDLGMISVPPELITRPGSLGAEEFNRIRQHVRITVDLIAPLGFHRDVGEYVHSHHEHWDGSGYPRRLFGDEIPLGARILCAAETFVALISARPFRPAMRTAEALDYLTAHSGGLLDPDVYDALVRAVRESHILGLGP
jgi:HD-GYP domain-containing protein (c-di-GMP phosphodiesterase class II)